MTTEADVIKSLRVARARVAAEMSVAMALMPDDVQSTLHFNGPCHAVERHPEFETLIKAMYPERFRS